MKTSVVRLAFFYAKLFIAAEHSELFIASCNAVNSSRIQERGILASIGAKSEIL